MINQEYQWLVKLVQSRYHHLNLTFKQAEQIYKYEQDKNTYSEKHYFSPWEEWDYELTTFRQILNNDQLASYETFLKENIQRYEKSLIEQDNEKSNEITYHEELINFYETKFLPDFFEDSFLLDFDWLYNDKAKIDFLRAEYKHFLNDSKQEILTNHFRYNRTFKPNELKVSLLRHSLLYIFPDYTPFKQQMDEPTKAVIHYLKPKLQVLSDKTEEFLKRKFEEMKKFSETNFKKYHGDISGWHVVVEKLTEEEKKEDHAMTLLLLDKEKYGWQLAVYFLFSGEGTERLKKR